MDCGFIENKNLCENNNNSSDKTIKQKQWRTTYEQVEICPLRSYGNETVIMHQSIPNAPCTPPGNCGAFARLVSPGGGVFANLARPGGRAFAHPGNNPEKFVDVFKGMFS